MSPSPEQPPWVPLREWDATSGGRWTGSLGLCLGQRLRGGPQIVTDIRATMFLMTSGDETCNGLSTVCADNTVTSSAWNRCYGNLAEKLLRRDKVTFGRRAI